MKRFLVLATVQVSLAALAVTTIGFLPQFTGMAWGQAGQKASVPHKIGLIDMAEVFKKYKKFDMLREDLKKEIGQSDAQAKQMVNQLKELSEKIKLLEENSPDYGKMEKQILSLKSELEAFRQGKQRDFLRREAQIYKTVYLEVSDAVKKYADYYNYTLIVRFNRQGLEEAENPQEVIQTMNQLVVDFREEDDITDSVLDYLNRKYSTTAAGPQPAGVQQN